MSVNVSRSKLYLRLLYEAGTLPLALDHVVSRYEPDWKKPITAAEVLAVVETGWSDLQEPVMEWWFAKYGEKASCEEIRQRLVGDTDTLPPLLTAEPSTPEAASL